MSRKAVIVDAGALSAQHNLHDERRRDHGDGQIYIAPAARDDLDRRIADEPDADTCRDGVGERDRERGEQCGRGFGHVIPIDVLQALRHQRGNEHQRGRGGEGGYGARQRRKE